MSAAPTDRLSGLRRLFAPPMADEQGKPAQDDLLSDLKENHEWYQIWIDDSHLYVLLLVCYRGEYYIYDPQDGRIEQKFASFEAARVDLWEDEFSQRCPSMKDGDNYVLEE